MPTKSKIEWCDATWNPIRGCSRVSEGCRNCYAERQAYRFAGPGKPYEGLVRWIGPKHSGHPQWTGEVALADEHTLTYPLRLKKPHRIFVNSMSDLFHEKVLPEWVCEIFGIMARTPQHAYLILTKRPIRMWETLREMLKIIREEKPNAAPFLPNVWLGVSVEDQKTAEERIPWLLDTPAAIRWISYEPALGPLRMGIYAYKNPNEQRELLDWVVCGGESGPGARPAHPDWFRSVRDQCIAAGVPFFFKQWGESVPCDQITTEELIGDARHGRKQPSRSCGNFCCREHGHIEHGDTLTVKCGKKIAGRLLDGRTWDEFPDEINEGKKTKVLLDGVMPKGQPMKLGVRGLYLQTLR